MQNPLIKYVSLAYRFQALRNGQLAAQRTTAPNQTLDNTFAMVNETLSTLQLKADGSITTPSGSYTKSSADLGRITVNMPGTTDEASSLIPRTRTFAYAATATGNILAVRTDGSTPGLIELLPLL